MTEARCCSGGRSKLPGTILPEKIVKALLPLLLAALPLPALAEACIIHTRDLDSGSSVQLCQQNRNIPAKMFHDGFCQPALKGQEISVEYAEQCPQDAFGVCSGARASGTPYQQDIHYYGVASDARILRPFCERNSQGQWLETKPAGTGPAG